ncbi:MAG: Trk family potassium uptake protein [Lachnospira sp.]|nr:Trk family potassium uptake protein [Lachnospira sp.]
MKKVQKRKLSHAQVMAAGFLTVIFIGALLLMLPVANRDGQWGNFLDSIFTSVSATCVTGLVVVDTYQNWTMFGQIVIILLIQIGGLGFITISVLFSLFLKKRIGLDKRNLIQESVNSLSLSGVVKLVRNIVKGTLLFEGVGAVLLSIRFIPKMGFWEGIYNGVFHSVSAFCNAGFDLMGKYEEYSSLVGYYDDFVVNITVMALIIIGGIGFIVWEDIRENKLRFKKYSLHTKIVLMSSAILIFGGAACFMVLEWNNTMADMNIYQRVITSLFASVTTRTAGFNTIDLGAMSQGSKILTVVLMFIGGSPGSTAGGIKTTTLVVFIVYIWSNLRNASGCNILGRRISDEDIKKSNMVLGLNLGLSVVAVLLICSVQEFVMEDLLLEVFSATGTVGLSTGITRQLNTFSQIVIMFLMYCGRVGGMTFALSFAYRKEPARLQYPEERINVG